MKKHMAVTLAFSIALAASSVSLPAKPTVAKAATTAIITQEAIDAINHLNDIRAHMGLLPVTISPALTQSATNHANYLLTNGFYSLGGGVNVHNEAQGQPYFTGVTVQDRILAAGGSDFKSNTGEVIGDFSGNDTQLINAFLETALHRDILLEPQLQYIGVSATSGNIVMDVANYNDPPAQALSADEVYPYDGQTNVPVSFYDSQESPNPLQGFGVDQTGSIITYDSPGMAVSGSTVNFHLKDSQGNKVSYYTDEFQGFSIGGHFFPKQFLKYNEKYTASVDFTDMYTGQHYSKTWSFTTMPDPNANSTPTPQPKPTTTTKYNSNNIGIKINGNYVSVSPQAKMVNDRTMIPLRGVLESLGANVQWVASTNSVVITKGSTTIKVTLGKKVGYVNDKTITLDAAPFEENGHSFIPLRFVTQALGVTVDWDSANWTATIDTK